jgi:hypothetical protein
MVGETRSLIMHVKTTATAAAAANATATATANVTDTASYTSNPLQWKRFQTHRKQRQEKSSLQIL